MTVKGESISTNAVVKKFIIKRKTSIRKTNNNGKSFCLDTIVSKKVLQLKF